MKRAAPDIGDIGHTPVAKNIRRVSMVTPTFAQPKAKLKWPTYDPKVDTPAAPQRIGSFDAFTKPSVFGGTRKVPTHHAKPQHILSEAA